MLLRQRNWTSNLRREPRRRIYPLSTVTRPRDHRSHVPAFLIRSSPFCNCHPVRNSVSPSRAGEKGSISAFPLLPTAERKEEQKFLCPLFRSFLRRTEIPLFPFFQDPICPKMRRGRKFSILKSRASPISLVAASPPLEGISHRASFPR
ncbi:unnamed protein product [Musa acuminata subsp. burmannicoides]